MRSQKKTILALALSLIMLVGGYGLVKAQDMPVDSAAAPMGNQAGMMENCPMMQGDMQKMGSME